MLSAGESHGAWLGPAPETNAFEAVFMTEQQVERHIRWDGLPAVVREIGGPVRAFRSFRGQRNYPGWYWSSTTGRRVGFESWVERDHLVALDFDPDVVDVLSQPFWLFWPDPQTGRRRRHAPDFLVRRRGDRWLVLDSRPFELIGDRDREAFAAMSAAAALVGWDYAVWDRLAPVVATNQRWLGGYRHPRCLNPGIARDLLEVFSTPQPLISGAERVGDPLGTLPVLYHLIWRGWLVADLTAVLSHRTVVRCAPDLANMAEVAELVNELAADELAAGAW
ncbi:MULTISPECIES: TnsA-like heteromeric transposase endonuclease subunit [Nocardia]|uniref:TnsA-like heteromeric transposase endonuclease subunit n=1 Tax=Nocardia TaxID=1817 RepID=UPI002454239A|nr:MULTISPECIES: TnsA-like heteromeric transposase endonuclease subunit [Nocardia]